MLADPGAGRRVRGGGGGRGDGGAAMLVLPLTVLDLSAHVAWLLLFVALAGVFVVVWLVSFVVLLWLSERLG